MSIDKIPAAINKSDTAYEALPGKRDVLFHPQDSTKLVRWSEHLYEEKDIVYPFKDHLDHLEKIYGIPNVHPQFVTSANSLPSAARSIGLKPDIDIIAIVDRIEDGVTLEELIKVRALDEQKVQEYDLLAQRLIAHLQDIYENGGLFCTEFYHFHQYLYSDAAPAGKKLILVDIEPLGFKALPEPASRLEGGIPLDLVRVLVNLAQEVNELEHYTGMKLAATSELITLLELIESEGVSNIEEAKQRALETLDAHDTDIVEYFHKFGETIKENREEGDDEDDLLLDTASLYQIDQCVPVKTYLEMNGDTC